jgi:hypothetical protein
MSLQCQRARNDSNDGEIAKAIESCKSNVLSTTCHSGSSGHLSDSPRQESFFQKDSRQAGVEEKERQTAWDI